MPALHQYFGTPFTTWILNRIYGSKFSDIHCGMRGITRSALEQMDLQSQSWEYASEMLWKAVLLDLRRTEVPVRFLKDQEGRMSHHRREGWTSPFKAAVDFDLRYFTPGTRQERRRETYVLQVDFILRDAVPNGFIQVNPLGLQITHFRVDQAFK